MNDCSSTSYFNITFTCTGATLIIYSFGRERRGSGDVGEVLDSLARSEQVHFKCNVQSQKDEYLGSSSPP